MTLNAYERETVVNMSDGDDVVRIWTAQRTVMTALDKRPDFRCVERGDFDGQPYAAYEIDADRFSLGRARKTRRDLTDAQREELSERAKEWRKRGDAA